MKNFKLLLFVVIVFVQTFSYGQNNAKKEKLFKKAHYYYDYQNYQLAKPYYLQILKIDSLDPVANFELGNCIFYAERDRIPAIRYYEKAQGEIVDAIYYLGRLYHLLEDFPKAIECYINYQNDPRKKTFDSKEVDFFLNKSYTAKRFKEYPRNVRIMNLGSNINSQYPDYVPIISQDERIMFFTSRREGSTGDQKDIFNQYFEDIYMSVFKDGIWQKAENLGFPINTETHEACLGISPDLSKMYIYRTNTQEIGGGIYESEFKNGKWQSPKWIEAEFNSQDPSEKTICLTVSPDSTEYYFVSNREGGYGGTDIYKVKRFGDGRWGIPENLGPEINTEYDEDAPFFHPKEATIYFSSKGHENMGDFDIFKSEILSDGSWSVPINLGYPINTVGGDRFLSVSLDGRRGYYSTKREGGFGDFDIYMIEMAFNTINYFVVKGSILDALDKTAIDAVITVVDTETNEVFGIFRPNLISANYVLLIEPGKKYRVEFKAEGYRSYNEVISYPLDSRESEFINDILLDKE